MKRLFDAREAAFGCEAVVNPPHAVFLKHRVAWFHDCFAAERSLALLDSCYKLTQPRAARQLLRANAGSAAATGGLLVFADLQRPVPTATQRGNQLHAGNQPALQ